jgi:hypothetical protein
MLKIYDNQVMLDDRKISAAPQSIAGITDIRGQGQSHGMGILPSRA